MSHTVAKVMFTAAAAGLAGVASFEVYESSGFFDNGRDANACAQALGHGEATDLYFDNNPTCASLIIELANRGTANEDTVTIDAVSDEVVILDGQQAATGMQVEELQAEGRKARDAVRDNRWKAALGGGTIVAAVTGIGVAGFGGWRRRLSKGPFNLGSNIGPEDPTSETTAREPATV